MDTRTTSEPLDPPEDTLIYQTKPSALDMQIDGNHYKDLKIQPIEYTMKNGLDPLQHSVIKYVTRFRDKQAPLVDLDKAKHCIDMLIEFELNKKQEE